MGTECTLGCTYSRLGIYCAKQSVYLPDPTVNGANTCLRQARCLSLSTPPAKSARRCATTCAWPAEAAASAGLAKVLPGRPLHGTRSPVPATMDQIGYLQRAEASAQQQHELDGL